jgi:hypothetical protein
MSVTSGQNEAGVMQALHALLAESIVLWGGRYSVQPLDTSSAIVLCDEAGAPFVIVRHHGSPSDMIRWSVTTLSGSSASLPQVSSSILGVLETLRKALDISPMESSTMRLGITPGAL